MGSKIYKISPWHEIKRKILTVKQKLHVYCCFIGTETLHRIVTKLSFSDVTHLTRYSPPPRAPTPSSPYSWRWWRAWHRGGRRGTPPWRPASRWWPDRRPSRRQSTGPECRCQVSRCGTRMESVRRFSRGFQKVAGEVNMLARMFNVGRWRSEFINDYRVFVRSQWQEKTNILL